MMNGTHTNGAQAEAWATTDLTEWRVEDRRGTKVRSVRVFARTWWAARVKGAERLKVDPCDPGLLCAPAGPPSDRPPSK